MLSDEQVERFHTDGFVIIEEGFLSDSALEALRERFDALFAGEYPTGVKPDEVNWKSGRDREDLTRQICNGWRADDTIAAQVLSDDTQEGVAAIYVACVAGPGEATPGTPF